MPHYHNFMFYDRYISIAIVFADTVHSQISEGWMSYETTRIAIDFFDHGLSTNAYRNSTVSQIG